MKTEWNGGKNPVRKGETCETVWLRSGQPLHGNGDGSYLRWSHEGNGGDIVAYAVTPERGHETPAKTLRELEVPVRPAERFAPAEPVETLRDRVAMAAITGLLANPGTVDGDTVDISEHCAQIALRIADAFMAARGDA